MQVDLVGYLLGALDPEEHEEVRRRIEADPELRAACEELMRSMQPLRDDASDYLPPPDLAERTCEFIADLDKPMPAAPRESSGGVRGWRLADLFTSAGMLAAVTLLFFPAIANSRYQAQRLNCQNNLMQMGMSLSHYSQQQGGYFPYVAADSKLAAAGIYAPLLRAGGYIDNDDVFNCPAGECATGPLPTLEELRRAEGAQLARLRAAMGGNYGYTLGYYENGQYNGVRDQGRRHYAIMADAPAQGPGDSGSLHHGGKGQNVLYEDGHVAYHEQCTEDCGDNFYLSERGYVETGLNANDAVIGRSEVSPRLFMAVPAP